MDRDSFREYLSKWSISPNLSNQNFHNKFIHSLALSYDVDVISVRSINRHYKDKVLNAKIIRENNIFWKYPLVKTNKIDKYLNLYKRIKNISMHDSKYIFVDVLNLSLLKVAIKYREKYGQKIIGIVTDNPENISFLRKGYKKKLLMLGKELDGYICLTKKLNHIYNPNFKPSIVIDGVSELTESYLPKQIDGDYIYFGGSLMKEYGVYNLIEAFKSLNKNNLKLVICGHHLNKDKLYSAIGNNENIMFVGAKNYEENLSLEKHSLVAVNPRPINSRIDECSIPSKTLEYLSNGCLTVSVYNSLLMEHYEPCIIWAKTGDASDLAEAIQKALDMNRTQREMLSILGKNKVMQYTSLEVINGEIKELLTKFSLDK